MLVIYPGIWSEPRALLGADAILVTHEHVDHIDVLRLAGLGAPAYAPAEANIPGLEVIRVEAGEAFTAAGFRVRAVGGRHAPVLMGGSSCANLGYLVEDELYHPGDALHALGEPLKMLLVPLQASWMKTGEAVDFVRTVGPERAIGIHDAQVNERGLASINGWLSQESQTDYRWLAPGTTVELEPEPTSSRSPDPHP